MQHTNKLNTKQKHPQFDFIFILIHVAQSCLQLQ